MSHIKEKIEKYIRRRIYIIEDINWFKKIGLTKNIKSRVKNIRTNMVYPIKSVIYTDIIKDAFKIEKDLHKINWEMRTQGEWFLGKLNLLGINFNNSLEEVYFKASDWRYRYNAS